MGRAKQAASLRALLPRRASHNPDSLVRPTHCGVGRAPSANVHTPAATAAAQPLDEPPQKRPGSCGLRAVPCARLSPVMPTPTSCRLALPSRTAPAARSAATAGASPRTARSVPSCGRTEPFFIVHDALSLQQSCTFVQTGSCRRAQLGQMSGTPLTDGRATQHHAGLHHRQCTVLGMLCLRQQHSCRSMGLSRQGMRT